MGKVNYISVKPELGKTEKEKEELKNKAEEINRKVEEIITERVKQGKIEKANTEDKTPKTNNNKMTSEEKKKITLDFFNKHYTKDDKYKTSAIYAYNKMKQETIINSISFIKFMEYLREDGKIINKREKYYIIKFRSNFIDNTNADETIEI